MNNVAEGVGQHLHLDMPGPLDRLFKEERAVAERRLGLASATRKSFRHLAGPDDEAHPTAPTPGCGLQHNGITQGCRDACCDLGRLESTLASRNSRYAFRSGEIPRRHLVAKQGQRLRARADEGQSGRLASTGEGSTLGEEPISGVDTVAAAFDSHRHQRPGIQVSRDRIAARNADRAAFGRDACMQAKGIRRCEDADALNPETCRRAGDPYGDLAPVGDQNPFEHPTSPQGLADSLPCGLDGSRVAVIMSSQPPRRQRPMCSEAAPCVSRGLASSAPRSPRHTPAP